MVLIVDGRLLPPAGSGAAMNNPNRATRHLSPPGRCGVVPRWCSGCSYSRMLARLLSHE